MCDLPEGSILNFQAEKLLLQHIGLVQLSKYLIMSDEIPNVGKKGYFVMWFFIILFLLVALILYVYFYNFRYLS